MVEIVSYAAPTMQAFSLIPKWTSTNHCTHKGFKKIGRLIMTKDSPHPTSSAACLQLHDSRIRWSRRAFEMTDTELKLIATLAQIGEISQPHIG